MKLEGSALVYLNGICGMVLIALTPSRFPSYLVPILLLWLSVLFLIGAFAVERYLLKRSAQRHHIRPPDIQKGNRILEVGLLILNIIAILVLWLAPLPTQPIDFEEFMTICLVVGFFIIVLNQDFIKLGKVLARRGFSAEES